MKKITFIILLLAFMVPATLYARKPVSFYKERWCKQFAGRVDAPTHDDSILIDCKTNDYVFVFEYSYRWRNAIGRAMYFSFETGRRPGIVLIIEKPREQFYFKLLKNLIHYFSLPIDTFQIGDGVPKDDLE